MERLWKPQRRGIKTPTAKETEAMAKLSKTKQPGRKTAPKMRAKRVVRRPR